MADGAEGGIAGKGNLVPAVLIAVAAAVGGMLAGGGGGTSSAAASEPAVEAPSTTARPDEPAGHGGPDVEPHPGTDEHGGPPAHADEPAHAEEPAHADDEPAHAGASWTYRGDTGPDAWGDLDAAYTACVEGSKQSPIDVHDPLPMSITDLVFEYGSTAATVEDTGHAIQVDVPAGHAVVVDGERFQLGQFHVHAPSEHTVDGQSYPLEIHLVHQADSGELAVVGILVEEGAPLRALDPVIAALPGQAGASAPTAGPLDLAALLPVDRTILRYSGSLTTPPCTEGVRWNLFRATVQMSAGQLQAFRDAYLGNNRPLQPSHGRTVVLDIGADE